MKINILVIFVLSILNRDVKGRINFISELTKEIIKNYAGANLKEPDFDFKNMQIRNISPKAFEDVMGTILTLDLSFNNLTNINPAVFQKLSKLTRLNLGDNKLVHINPLLFDGLKNLFELKLKKCELQLIDHSLFKSLAKLNKLDLSLF